MSKNGFVSAWRKPADKRIAEKLGLAVCALLATTQSPAADWLYDASVLSYSEKDSQQQDRVSVLEPLLTLTQQNAPDDFFQLSLAYDSLSGASPNGANASSKLQQFRGFSVLPGYTPLDPGFKDNRVAVSASVEKPIDRFSRYQLGVSFSSETDYNSLGGNLSLIRDLDNKLTTLTISGAYSYDAVNPHGGFHDGFTSIFATPKAGEKVTTTTSASGGRGGGEESLFPGKIKQVFDGIVGLTRVVNRFTLLNFNYGLSFLSGYLTDPYKIISVVDRQGLPVDYVWEKRPDTRLKQTLKGSLVTAIGNDSLHLDYRYYWDDWGVTANTFDASYHLSLGSHWYARPHYRFNRQNRADFYRISLNQGEANPAFASADYRLSDMTTTTLGGAIGYKVSPRLTLKASIEQIWQQGDNHPAQAIGDQRRNELFPDLSFWALTLGVKGRW